MTLEEVSAHLEIQQVLYTYCRGVDRGNAALISSIYHEDGRDTHGPWAGLGSEFGPMLVAEMDKAQIAGQHHITNALIELDGDVANVESYYLAMHPQPDENGGADYHVFTGGRYIDKFARRGGVWKIAARVVTIDWSRTSENTPWEMQQQFHGGARRERDVSAGHFKTHG